MVENNENEIARESRGISRRTVMRTAAWTAPVVSVAAAAPAFATSASVMLTASNPIFTPSQASTGDSLLGTLTSTDSSTPTGTAVTLSSSAAWVNLGTVAAPSSSAVVLTQDAAGHFSQGVLYDPSKAEPGATATVTAQYTDGDSVLHTAAWTFTFFVPNLYVVRLGDANGLGSGPTAAYLDEFKTSGGAVQSTVAIPSTDPLSALTINGGATSEGALSLSPDHTTVALAGYQTVANTTGGSVASSTAASVKRVVGLVSASGNPDTSTVLGGADNLSGNNARAAVTNGSSSASNPLAVWAVGGAGSVAYAAHGTTSTSTQISTAVPNARVIGIYGNELYFSSGSGVRAVYKISGAPPTSGTTAATAIVPTGTANVGTSTSNGSPYGFIALAVSGPAVDTIYVVDDGNAAAAAAGIYRSTFNGSSWSAPVFAGVVAGYRGLTGYVDKSGSTTVVRMFATTAATGTAVDSLVSFADSTPSGPGITLSAPTTLATAAAGTVFRGVAFKPYA